MTALRLTPMSAAISRQERPASKCAFQEFDAFGGPGRYVGEHAGGPSVVDDRPRFRQLPVGESVRVTQSSLQDVLPLSRIDKQPVLDGEPDAFLDQGLCDAGNAGAVGALSHQFFQIGDGRERQRNGNAVGFGFFCGHARTLASYSVY